MAREIVSDPSYSIARLSFFHSLGVDDEKIDAIKASDIASSDGPNLSMVKSFLLPATTP